MNYTLDWDRARREVDIEQYFLFKMGSLYSFDKYKKAYVLEQNGSHGDIIRFFHHERTGVKMYYSIMNQDSGDIIQFIKKRILNNTAALPGEINLELRQFLGGNEPKAYLKPIETYFAQDFDIENTSDYKCDGDIIQKIDIHNEYLMHYRKLDKSTFNSGIFQDILFTYKKQNITSLSYFVKDINDSVVGIHRVFTSKGEYFNKKWFDGNTKNSIGFTFSQKPEITETLSIFESVFDAMSYCENYNPANTQYCSSNGELSFNKAKLINKYFGLNGFQKLILGNDNDVSGAYFNLNIIVSFIEGVVQVRKTTQSIILDIVSVVPKNFKILKQFFKKQDNVSAEENSENYFTETLSQNNTKFIFVITNTKESIQFFVGLLLRIWKLDDFISIHLPLNKDFNDDLIEKKHPSHD